MGEEEKPQEPKAEDSPPPPAAAAADAEEKGEEKAPSPSPLVLYVDLHCVGCAKKIEKSLFRITGVVGVEMDMVKNQVRVKGAVEPETVCDQLTKKTKRHAKVLSSPPPPPAIINDPAPAPAPAVVVVESTVELNVNMHCEACAQQLKRSILRMKGVTRVETEVSSGKVRVSGSMDGEKLVDYVYRRTKKQAKIIPEPAPEPAPAPEPEPEKATKEEGEEKPAAAGEEKDKEEGGGGEVEKAAEEDKKEVSAASNDSNEEGRGMEKMMMMYSSSYQPLYVIDRIPPPQLFSDENPNACSIS